MSDAEGAGVSPSFEIVGTPLNTKLLSAVQCSVIVSPTFGSSFAAVARRALGPSSCAADCGTPANRRPGHRFCRQPGTIQPGGVCDRLVGQYDIAPTITDWVGFDHVRYADSPGVSFAPTLAGAPQEDDRDAVFFEQEETRAIHTGKFAY